MTSISEERLKSARLQVLLGRKTRLATHALKECGLSNAEIAEKLDMTENMVRKVLDRPLRKKV